MSPPSGQIRLSESEVGIKSADSNSLEEIKIEILHRSISSGSNGTPFRGSSDIGANEEALRQFKSLNEP